MSASGSIMSTTVPVLPASGLPTDQLSAAVAIVEIVTAAVVLGGLAINRAIKKHTEAEHIKHIESVLKIQKETLDTVGMERFFTRASDKDPYLGLFLPSDTLMLMSKTTPIFNKDTDKSVRHVLNAIAYLIEYHEYRIKHRGEKEDDVTSSVLSGLITILGRDCVKFTDIPKTLEILKMVHQFIEKFASPSEQSEYVSFRRVNLTQSASEISQAIFILKTRSLSLSLGTRVLQTLTVSDGSLIRLLTNIVKLTVPYKYWELLETFNPQRLAEGRLRNRFVYSSGYPWDFTTRILKAIELPKNLLTEWIMQNSRDFLLALNLNDNPDEKGSFINPAKFKVPADFERYAKQLLQALHDTESFLSLKVKVNDGRNAANAFVPIEKDDLPLVINFLSKLMLLIHCLNIARYMGAHLRDSLEEYGVSRYKKFPHDMVFIFGVVKDFRDYITRLAQGITQQMSAIQASQKNAMLTPKMGNGIKTVIEKEIEFINKEVCGELQGLYDWHEESLLHHHGNKDVTRDNVRIQAGDDVLMMMHRLATAFEFPIHDNVRVVVDTPPVTYSLKSESATKLARSLHLIEKHQQSNQAPADEIKKYNFMQDALSLVFAHTLRMTDDKTDERQEKAHFVQQLLLTHIIAFNSLLKMQPAERDAGWAEFARNVRLSTENEESAKFIDKRKAWTVCFWKTRTRELLDKVLVGSETLAGMHRHRP